MNITERNELLVEQSIIYDDVDLFKSMITDVNTLSFSSKYDIFVDMKLNILRYIARNGVDLNSLINEVIQTMMFDDRTFQYRFRPTIYLVELIMSLSVNNSFFVLLMDHPELLALYLGKSDISSYVYIDSQSFIISILYNLYMSNLKLTVDDNFLKSLKLLLDNNIIDVRDDATSARISINMSHDVKVMRLFKEYGFRHTQQTIIDSIRNIAKRDISKTLLYAFDNIIGDFNVNARFRINNTNFDNILSYIIDQARRDEDAFTLISHALEYVSDMNIITTAHNYILSSRVRYDKTRYLLEQNINNITLDSDFNLISAHRLVNFLRTNVLHDNVISMVESALYYKPFIRDTDKRALYEMKISTVLRTKLEKEIIDTSTLNLMNVSPFGVIPPEIMKSILSFL